MMTFLSYQPLASYLPYPEKSSIPRFMLYAQKINKSKTKVPDFSKIHAKAFGNMENVSDFWAKKKSGTTPMGKVKEGI